MAAVQSCVDFEKFFECVLLALVDDSGMLRVNYLPMAMGCPKYFIYIILHICPSGVAPLLVSKLLDFGSLALALVIVVYNLGLDGGCASDF